MTQGLELTETEYQIVKTAALVLALGLTVTLQRWLPYRAMVGSWRANSGLAALNGVVLGLVCTGCACAVSRWASGNAWGLLNLTQVPLWASIAVSALALDAIAYLWHRANHRAPLLWRFHQAHHSDATFTATTALRFHPGELLLALPLRLATVIAFGLPIAGVILFEVAFAFANLLEHGNIALPRRLERTLAGVFVTPALHRWHHGRGATQLDSNYGTDFTFWDRMLRTFTDSRSDVRVEIGLPGIDERLNTLGILRLPMAGAFRPAARED